MAQLDMTKLTDEQRDKLAQFKATQKQVQTLEDLANMVQELLNVVEEQGAQGGKRTDSLGALLTDMRESLAAIKDKEAPESPDYAKPVVQAVQKLENALRDSLKVKPVINLPKLDAPQVSVNPPDVDLKGVEKILKKDIPKAFDQAIKSIPQTEIPETDFTPLLNQLKEMSDQLTSIDTASRLKPQFPTTLKVTNPDGSSIGSIPAEVEIKNDSGSAVPAKLIDANSVSALFGPQGAQYTASIPLKTVVDKASTTSVVYVGKASIGTATSAASWQIQKIDKTVTDVTTITWGGGSNAFNQVWNNRATTVTYS